MDIILDEKAKAEEIIKNKEMNMNKPTKTIQLLIKYYNNQGKDKEEIRKLIENFMHDNYKGFNSSRWQDKLDSMVKVYTNDKYKLIKIDDIIITQAELDKIRKLDNINLEKLAFSLLVYAKVGNQINKNNNNWVNAKKNMILKDALIKNRKKIDKIQLFRELNKSGYIEFAKVIDKTGIRVLFLKEDSEIGIKLNDFTHFISEYLQWRKGYCIVCGRKLNMQGKNYSQKYCSKCAKEIDSKNSKKRFKKWYKIHNI